MEFKRKFFWGGIVLISVGLKPMLAVASCDAAITTPFEYVSLLSHDNMKRMDNENHLDDICSLQMKTFNPQHYQECVEGALRPIDEDLKVFDKPDGTEIASLIVSYPPGKFLSAKVVTPKKSVPYVPTIYLDDWGYGPWFHATLLDRRENWVLISLPLVKSGWIKKDNPDVWSLRSDTLTGQVYAFAGKSSGMILLGHDAKSLTFRDEQPTDAGCDASVPTATHVYLPYTYKVKDLYNDSCEFLIVPTHLKGC